MFGVRARIEASEGAEARLRCAAEDDRGKPHAAMAPIWARESRAAARAGISRPAYLLEDPDP